MIHRYKQFIYLLLAATFVFASCVVKKYEQPGMAVQGQLYRDTTAMNTTGIDTLAADTLSIADLPYTQLFSDTVLQNLIAEGIDQNLDLKTAVQRINEAQANFRQSKAAFYPSLNANAAASRNKQSPASINLPPDLIGTFPLATSSYQLSLSTSWEDRCVG